MTKWVNSLLSWFILLSNYSYVFCILLFPIMLKRGVVKTSKNGVNCSK